MYTTVHSLHNRDQCVEVFVWSCMHGRSREGFMWKKEEGSHCKDVHFYLTAWQVHHDKSWPKNMGKKTKNICGVWCLVTRLFCGNLVYRGTKFYRSVVTSVALSRCAFFHLVMHSPSFHVIKSVTVSNLYFLSLSPFVHHRQLFYPRSGPW